MDSELIAAHSAHFTGRFLPWHRLYLHTMEGLLKDKCGYEGYMTYWDWTIGKSDKTNLFLQRVFRYRAISDSHDIEHSPIFNGDPIAGLGTFPNASTNFELSDGAFRDIIRAYPLAHHLQRNYTLRVRFHLLSPEQVSKVEL